MRKCKECQEPKTLEEFSILKLGKEGRHPICKKCRSKDSKHRYCTKWRGSRYGLTIEDYNSLHKAQDGRCAICLRVPEKWLCIDHDHITGEVRGLLCNNCNAMLGMSGDSPELLQRGIEYLLCNDYKFVGTVESE